MLYFIVALDSFFERKSACALGQRYALSHEDFRVLQGGRSRRTECARIEANIECARIEANAERTAIETNAAKHENIMVLGLCIEADV